MPIRRLPSGKYQAKYLHPHHKFTSSGSRNYITAPATFRTKGEAREWLTRTEADIASGRWKSPEQVEADRIAAEIEAAHGALTFGSYSADWMKVRDIRHSTRKGYESYLRNHLLPRWADTPLQAITTPAVRVWLSELAPGAPRARKLSFDLFASIMATAAEDGLIVSSPCVPRMLSKVKAPNVPQKRRPHVPQAVTLEQLTVTAEDVPEYLRLPVLLAGNVGLRGGEVRALTGASVEVRPDQTVWLRITQAVTGQGKDLRIGLPKTPRSIRTVPVPESLADEVVARAQEVGAKGFLFHQQGKDSSHVIPYTTWRRNVGRAADHAGVEGMSPHDLRTTTASLAAANGAQPTETRDLLGHTTVQMTGHYTHTSADQLARIVGGIDRERTNPTSNVVDINTKRTKTA